MNISPAGVLEMAVAAAAPIAASALEHDTPTQLVEALHSAFGNHHVRAVHAKGVILEGTFVPTADARRVNAAAHFAGPAVPITVRFSDFTGLPDIPDTVADASPRGLAIKFMLPGGGETDVVSHSFNGFPTATSDEFAQLMRAIGASRSGASKPTALERFLESHPIAKTFLSSQKPPPVSYATLGYFGVNAFAFVDAQGRTIFVRYRFVPDAGELFLSPTELAKTGPNYLGQEIVQRVASAPIQFHWYAQVAETSDAIDDPSIAWPESRRLIKLGTLTIERRTDDQVRGDQRLLFLPGRLPKGIEIADPMVAARSAAYPISFGERQ